MTVWCEILANGIIGPYFFENEAENAVTVNSVRYVAMIQNFLIPQLEGFPVNEHTLFQQDGATSHTARISMNAASALFPGRIVSRNDFFLWGYLKTNVFADDPPRTIPALKQRIRDEIAAIPVDMLRKVMQNFQARLQECINCNGGHLSDVVFKK